MNINESEYKVKSDVLFGKENYLFLFQGAQRQFDYLLGKERVTELSTLNFKSNIESRSKYCLNKNIDYLHIVFPSKPLVKKKYLPNTFLYVESLYNKYYEEKISKQFLDFIYYPLEDLKNIEKKYSTFLKTDTHNTNKGHKYLTYKILKKMGMSIVKKSSNSYFKKEIFNGDLLLMLKEKYDIQEDIYYYYPEQYKIIGNRHFLPGNSNEVQIIYNYSSYTNKRCLIFGDSFFKDLLPFLIPYFSNILYLKTSFFQRDIIELYSPNTIFTGNAERYLSNVSSDRESNNFLLNLYADIKYTPNKEYLKFFTGTLSYKYHKILFENLKNEVDLKLKPSLKLFKNYKCHSNIKLVYSSKLVFKVKNIGELWFFCLSFQKNQLYEFSFHIRSSICSVFKLFYSIENNENYPFNKNRMISQYIDKGENKFKLKLFSSVLGNILRIDPLDRSGTIEFIDVEIKEI